MRSAPRASQFPGVSADVDVVVIGAGVVGVATAAALARRGRSVVIVDRHAGPARETSSRNSGVIHAGLYYPEGSLKAASCHEGRRMLYERCARLGIPHRKTGKLVVAVDDAEAAQLDALRTRAERTGAEGLSLLDGPEVRAREPLLRATAALWSAESGIVDAHALVDSYLAEARAHGVDIAFVNEVIAIEPGPSGCTVRTRDPRGDAFDLRAAFAVNAAGLEADRVAALAGVDIDACGLRIHWCKGDYFALAASVPRPKTPLVYPMPAGPGLGIHLTTDLGGRCTAGPDARYCNALDYDVDPARAGAFATSIARYLPHVRAPDLSPDYAGIRPKLAGPGEPFRDFVLARGDAWGAPRTVHLIGIESPGLTAAPSLAERTATLIG